MTLQTYTATLTSIHFDFLASLSLTTTFPVPQLVKLSSIMNLAILEIVHAPGDGAQSGISDRLIRAWHQAALDDGAFSVLRILKLWNHKEVTETSLTYLNSFPILALFDVRSCSFDTRSRALARTLGWTSTLDVGILSFFEAMCVERAVVKRATDEKNPLPIRRAPSHQLDEDSIVTRIPRADVTAFIISPAFSVSKETADAILHWDGRQRIGDLSERRYPDKSFKEVRGGVTNQHLCNTSCSLETWDFLTYTIFSKIGELRSDRDLKRAGVNIGEQVVINDELVNSVPLAALRLGPFLKSLKPSVYTNPVKSFYGSAYTERSNPHLTELIRDYPKNKSPALVDIRPAVSPDLGSIAFFRTKAPHRRPDSASSQEFAKDEANEAKTAGLGESADSKRSSFADPFKRQTKFMQNKKQKLGDVLDSFM